MIYFELLQTFTINDNWVQWINQFSFYVEYCYLRLRWNHDKVSNFFAKIYSQVVNITAIIIIEFSRPIYWVIFWNLLAYQKWWIKFCRIFGSREFFSSINDIFSIIFKTTYDCGELSICNLFWREFIRAIIKYWWIYLLNCGNFCFYWRNGHKKD